MQSFGSKYPCNVFVFIMILRLILTRLKRIKTIDILKVRNTKIFKKLEIEAWK